MSETPFSIEYLRQSIELAKAYLESATAQFENARSELKRAETALQRIVQDGIEQGIAELPSCDLPPNEHRATHRSGRPPKIESDPELKAFIAARITRMTYKRIAEEVAEHFPKPRCVSSSTIHAWWRKSGRNPNRT